MIIQPIVNIAEICALHGIEKAVICPGSRSALLTLAFARHPKLETFVIPDERSAGFIALGLSQSSRKSVAIICTSGTAAANLYPAIIEAYYAQTPLLVFTADRPPELIDQQDGQTIRQQNIYKNHILASFQYPDSFDHTDAAWHSEKMISEAIIKANGKSKGPVHVNVPMREPFYPSPDEILQYSKSIKIIQAEQYANQPSPQQKDILISDLNKYKKIMILVGQSECSAKILDLLGRIQKDQKWVIVGDIISNVHRLEDAIAHHDIVLNKPLNKPELAPDLLITIGRSVLSKTLKNFLHETGPRSHWHVGEIEEVVDTFKSLTKKVLLPPEDFFTIICESTIKINKTQNSFFDHWKEKDLQADVFIKKYLSGNTLSEFHAVYTILNYLPINSALHLANSMPVRYANYIGINNDNKIQVWTNRGTSGIDGCTSTVIGHALNSSSLHTIITGDMAFFYDRNALWHNHIPFNLRIIILNNHGGGIFRLINGPKQLNELEEFFETTQKLNAANTARDFGMKYFSVKSMDAFREFLDEFFDEKTGPSILEIETDRSTNQQVFEDFIHNSSLL